MTSPDTASDCLSLLERHTPPDLDRVRLTAADRAALKQQGIKIEFPEVAPPPTRRQPPRDFQPRVGYRTEYGSARKLARQFLALPRGHGAQVLFAEKHKIPVTTLASAIRRLKLDQAENRLRAA